MKLDQRKNNKKTPPPVEVKGRNEEIHYGHLPVQGPRLDAGYRHAPFPGTGLNLAVTADAGSG